VFRRLTAFLLLLIGVAGIALVAAGIVACWTKLPPLGQRASTVCERAERILGVTAESLSQVKVSLDKARADLGTIKEAEKALPQAEPAKQRLRRTASRKVAEQLSPDLGDVRQKLATLTDVAMVANSLLEGLDQVPLAHMLPLEPDQFQDAERHLSNVTRSAQRLQTMLGPLPDGGGGVEAQTSEMQDALGRVGAKVDGLLDRVEQARDRVGGLRSDLLRWLPFAEVGATILLIWIGLGQLSLLVHGWSLYRKPTAPVSRSP
jgi:hypothetical protein